MRVPCAHHKVLAVRRETGEHNIRREEDRITHKQAQYAVKEVYGFGQGTCRDVCDVRLSVYQRLHTGGITCVPFWSCVSQ